MREPLVHFLAIGLALFVVNGIDQRPDEEAATGETIIISEGRVNQIAESFVLLAGRVPTREELEALVDDFVSEEVGYREAVAMGLDADDTIVRRRMRQKLEFLIEDGAASDRADAGRAAGLAGRQSRSAIACPNAARCATSCSAPTSAARAPLADADGRARHAPNGGGDPAKLGDNSMLPAAIAAHHAGRRRRPVRRQTSPPPPSRTRAKAGSALSPRPSASTSCW